MTPRIAREKQTVAAMIQIFCRSKHTAQAQLCPECQRLLEYAQNQLDCCPFGDLKGTCADCSIHCYPPEWQERIRIVMRYSGPRMLWRHPLLALQHLWDRLISFQPR